jgi:hypothetical protein
VHERSIRCSENGEGLGDGTIRYEGVAPVRALLVHPEKRGLRSHHIMTDLGNPLFQLQPEVRMRNPDE